MTLAIEPNAAEVNLRTAVDWTRIDGGETLYPRVTGAYARSDEVESEDAEK